MHHEGLVAILLTIPTIIFISPFFSRILNIPTIPIEIILGSLATYVGLLHDTEIFKIIAEAGFLFLMFLAGLEIDFKKILKVDKLIIKNSIIYLLILYFLSFLSVRYFDLSNFFVVSLPLISIGIVATLSKEYGKDTDWIKFSMIVGTIGEVVSIIIFTIVGSALEFGLSSEFYKTLILLTIFFIIVSFSFKIFRVLFWWYPQIKTMLMPHLDNQEKDIRLSMAIFLISIAVMEYLHLEVAFGAFLAGVFIATFFEHQRNLPHKLESIGYGFLIPIFFIHIGVSFKIESIFIDGLFQMACLIAFLMIFIRFLSSLVFVEHLGLKKNTLFALSHSVPLTLLIALATMAYNSNTIDEFHYFAFILAALLELIVVMILIKFILNFNLNKNRV
jgi:Kef-type K+ transport system membrane component KefB